MRRATAPALVPGGAALHAMRAFVARQDAAEAGQPGQATVSALFRRWHALELYKAAHAPPGAADDEAAFQLRDIADHMAGALAADLREVALKLAMVQAGLRRDMDLIDRNTPELALLGSALVDLLALADGPPQAGSAP